jgi:hypothetical protein
MLIAVLVLSPIALFFVGCQEENTSSAAAETPDEIRRHRLIATENLELREEIARKDAQIADMRDQIAQCEQEKADFQRKADQELQESIEGILGTVMDKNAELESENAELKAQIEQLKQSQ